MKQFQAEIRQNRPVAESWRELVISWDEAAGAPVPGQFFMLRVSAFSDPLLRRPLAFSSYAGAASGSRSAESGQGAVASAIYQIRGGATRLLAELSPGSGIDVIGPLGVAFPAPSDAETAVLAGGGIGLGPLLFLADSLSASARGAGESRLVLGFRSSSHLPALELPAGTVVCTDDGSEGFHGSPVDWISRNFPRNAEPTGSDRVRIYGCGPAPMLAALAALSAERGWPASLSAEQWMACGVGACMGCALPRADGQGYLRACADGPVFEASAIDWRPQ